MLLLRGRRQFLAVAAGVGIDWTFTSSNDAGGANMSTVMVRLVAVVVSVGGLAITALMLGLVSGALAFSCDKCLDGCRDGIVVPRTIYSEYESARVRVFSGTKNVPNAQLTHVFFCLSRHNWRQD